MEKLREEYLSAASNNKSQSRAALARLAFDRITNPYPKGDPRYVMTFEEETEAAKAVKLDQVKAFYKNFYGASDATCAIVGDFDRLKWKKC
jgi:zinc protease